MSVPVVLVKQAQWSDIRQIYRAVFKPGPQVENFAAPNEWSRALNKVPVEDDGKIVTGSGDKKAERKADKKAEKKAK